MKIKATSIFRAVLFVPVPQLQPFLKLTLLLALQLNFPPPDALTVFLSFISMLMLEVTLALMILLCYVPAPISSTILANVFVFPILSNLFYQPPNWQLFCSSLYFTFSLIRSLVSFLVVTATFTASVMAPYIKVVSFRFANQLAVSLMPYSRPEYTLGPHLSPLYTRIVFLMTLVHLSSPLFQTNIKNFFQTKILSNKFQKWIPLHSILMSKILFLIRCSAWPSLVQKQYL